jgi:hypothetical protein
MDKIWTEGLPCQINMDRWTSLPDKYGQMYLPAR